MTRTPHRIDLADVARRLGGDISTYPYVIRVLLENLCRNQAWGAPVSDLEISALADWRNHLDADLPLYVTRVILPDSSGLPVLQDLAALRDAVADAGGDPARVDTSLPVDVIVDHSLQVDFAGSADAQPRNLAREYERNAERYEFLKWAQQAFGGVTIHPPGSGIIHQVNLEKIARVVQTCERSDGLWAYPEFVIGGDSHTPMVNALGVLGWGVGGIDAEAALLGQAYTFPVPEVVGVRLVGEIVEPALTSDAALLVSQILRRARVAGAMVEFFGPAVSSLLLQERATIANMAPEYGATCGFFPVDDRTLEYLRATARDPDHVELVCGYCRGNHLFRHHDAPEPQYSRVIEIDLSQACQSMAGPRRPQERLPVGEIGADFHRRLPLPLADDGFAVVAASPDNAPDGRSTTLAQGEAAASLAHGSVVLAAITSCTNTSNPVVMLAAGLLARNAVARGLSCAPWVKTSLAPGSRAVTGYLQDAGLTAALEALGFYTIGYGCTTCGGKSGPLPVEVLRQIQDRSLVTVAVLSGNRNFEGRIHKAIRANYIGSPPMVVAYALAGRIDIDFDAEPIGTGTDGQAVYLRELWPSREEIAALLPLANSPQTFVDAYRRQTPEWNALQAPTGPRFNWNPASTYLVEPPFFRQDLEGSTVDALSRALRETRVLAAFGDGVTTDHISPGGEIPADTPAGLYLQSLGVQPKDFNSYVGRRCNFEVMTRATFANIRIRNALTPDVEGGVTQYFPTGEILTIHEAAERYRRTGITTIVLAGKEYGTGSSRDWAAKGSQLLGVRAVIAEGFERIHRANLIGMGVLPLAFSADQGWRALGLDGSEVICLQNVEGAILRGEPVHVIAKGPKGEVRFDVRAQILTDAERALMREGGIPRSVLRGLLTPA